MVAQVNSATCAPVLFATPVGKADVKRKTAGAMHSCMLHGQTEPHASELHASQVPIGSISACTK